MAGSMVEGSFSRLCWPVELVWLKRTPEALSLQLDGADQHRVQRYVSNVSVPSAYVTKKTRRDSKRKVHCSCVLAAALPRDTPTTNPPPPLRRGLTLVPGLDGQHERREPIWRAIALPDIEMTTEWHH